MRAMARHTIILDGRSLSLGALLASVLAIIAAGALSLARPAAIAAPIHRPEVYLVSLSSMSLPDADVWLVCYTVDGLAQAVELPLSRDPEEFLAHLARFGRIEGRP